MKKQRLILVLTVVALMVALMAPAAFALPDIEEFDKEGWICGVEEGFVANHCLNVSSNGKTLNIKVFEPDPRGPQESASTDPKADGRPCPNDAGGSGPFGADPTAGDGTWWDYLWGSPDGSALYVCHHSGQQ